MAQASFNVGDKVVVHLNLAKFQEPQATVEIGWEPGMEKCIGQVGTVVAEQPSYVEVRMVFSTYSIKLGRLNASF